MKKRALRISWLALVLLVASVSAEDQSNIVDQRVYQDSVNGCAPASILNLLQNSKEPYQAIYFESGASDEARMRSVIDRYFRHRKSVVYPRVNRWGAHGIQTADVATGLNELLEDNQLPALNARYLDRLEGESVQKHLDRITGYFQDSIENGVTPILSLRSFVVRHREEENFAPAWETGRNHFVVITEVKADPSKAGVEFVALDPWMGREVGIFMHPEANGQAFAALKGIEETGEWLKGVPFLQVVAPLVSSVQPKNLKWSERFIVVANFLIGDF